MKLVTLPNKIIQAEHHTLLIMRGEETCQAVCVVGDEASTGIVRSMLSHIETIASRKLDNGDVAFDGRIWITPADLRQSFRLRTA